MNEILAQLYGPSGRLDKNGRATDATASLEAWNGFAKAFSNLAGAIRDDEAIPLNLSIKLKAGGDYLAIIQRAGKHHPEVCFGYGESIWSALDNLSRGLAKYGWKPDKFAMERIAKAYGEEQE